MDIHLYIHAAQYEILSDIAKIISRIDAPEGKISHN